VLASGKVINASSKTNPNLYRALKGGSNNFGVLTRFDVSTFPVSVYLGGSIISLFSSAGSQIQVFADLVNAKVYDEFLSIILTLVWSSSSGFIISNNLGHSSPNSSLISPPASVQKFLDIQPQLLTTLRVASASDFVNELTTSGTGLSGLRNHFATATVKADAGFLSEVVGMWNNTMNPLISGTSLATGSFSFEPVPSVMIAKSEGSSLGLSPRDGNLVVVQINFTWLSATEDALFEAAARSLVETIDSQAKLKNVYNSYKYLNYAAGWQDVIDGYGKEAKEELRATSSHYDSRGLFQNVVRGGYKLFV
jgi:hypothetical protein